MESAKLEPWMLLSDWRADESLVDGLHWPSQRQRSQVERPRHIGGH